MSLHLRQVALVASSLKPVITDLSSIFGIQACHVDPGLSIWGLENTLLPVGSNFLEVVAPTEDGTAAGRFLERRGGDGGYMVICQTETRELQHAARERAAQHGVRVAYESDEREGFNIMQLHPRDLEAAFLEIDWDVEADFTGRWEPAGGFKWRPHVRSDRVTRIAGVELQCENPARLAQKWAAIAAAPVESRDGQSVVRLGNAVLRFIEESDNRGPGLSGVDLQVDKIGDILTAARTSGKLVSEQEVLICGTRFYLHPQN